MLAGASTRRPPPHHRSPRFFALSRSTRADDDPALELGPTEAVPPALCALKLRAARSRLPDLRGTNDYAQKSLLEKLSPPRREARRLTEDIAVQEARRRLAASRWDPQ